MIARKIVIVTIGQPSTNPRMVKEYSALKQAGYQVKVLYAHWADWASATDDKWFSDGYLDRNDFILAGGSPGYQRRVFLFSRLFFRIARFFTFRVPLPFFWKWALNRPAFFLAKMAKKEKAGLFIAHNLAALPAAQQAAAQGHVLYAFDAEDYHLGQSETDSGKEQALVKKIEDTYMPGCAYVSAASPLIAATYSSRLSIKDVLVINNVFSIRHLQPEPLPYRPGDPLKLFWFSQTVGPDRGLETLIPALGALRHHPITCTILGSCSETERQRLLSFAAANQVREEQINFMTPVPPDEVFSIAGRHHIGLAIETNRTLNRKIALTNKIFTYPLAGLVIIATDTPGQRDFLERYPGAGVLYPDGDDQALARLLETFLKDPGQLNACRIQAWNFARTALNWEQEQAGLLARVKTLLP